MLNIKPVLNVLYEGPSQYFEVSVLLAFSPKSHTQS